MRLLVLLFLTVIVVGCDSDAQGPGADGQTTSETGDTDDTGDTGDTEQTLDTQGDVLGPACGHRVDTAIVQLGFNVVLDESGAAQQPQGRPLQEGWTLGESSTEIDDHNSREYGRIAAYMMPIRDALICDIAILDKADWMSMTQILTLNNIRTQQDLSGLPPEQVY